METLPATQSLRELTMLSQMIETHIILNDGILDADTEAQLAAINDSLSFKIDGYHFTIERLEKTIEIHAALMKEHSDYISKLEKSVNYLKQSLMQSALDLNKEILNGNRVSLKLVLNPPSVLITEESLIPEEFKSTKVVETIDKKKIGEVLKSGLTIPGTDLIQTKRIKLSIKKELLK